jgi:branched-chain amino acid transport system substrate-binding protein
MARTNHGERARWGILVASLMLALAAPARAQVTEGEVTIGMSAPFSGVAKELGVQMRTGIEVALAAQNAAGGVHGRKLKLIPFDDGYEPARTLGAMKELVEKRKVFAILGNVGTPTAAVAVPYANEKQIVFFGAFTGAPLLRNDLPDRWVFNYRASYAEETAAMVRYLVDTRRIDPAKIAVFAQQDGYGDAGFDGVARTMRRLRRDPTKVLRVGYKRNTADVDDAVATIRRRAKEVQAVIMVATYKPAARFIEKLRDANVPLIFSNVSFVGSNELAEELSQLGPKYAEGVIVTQVVPIPTSQASSMLRFREELKKYAPGEKPGFISVEGWLATRLFIEGLQRAGKQLTADALVDGLEQIKGLDLGIGVPLSFGPSEHQASHRVWGTVMDGKGTFNVLELE